MVKMSLNKTLAPLLWLMLAFYADLVVAFKITGATGGIDPETGARPYRYDISDFQLHGAAFDLYILSLSSFQSASQSDPLSYFQIAGIHGYPRGPWDGVEGTGLYPGYCMHASTPFPTWHRPYLALFEQIIWTYAQEIAEMYSDSQRAEYRSAAASLRIPYWDWAISPGLPAVATEPSILVNTPEGRRTIRNPLYSYRFQSDAAGNGFPQGHPLANMQETVRWWNSQTQSSNQTAATAAMYASAASVLAMTYQLLTFTDDYTVFSCTWPGGVWTGANNLEGIHNSIHNAVGGYGHMQFPELAGFDPIFWLHHANADRLFAMWQALYPDSYIVSTVNAYGSYYEPAGTVDSGATGLAPFHSGDDGTLFTSDQVRGMSIFGYSYPEIPDWQLDREQLTQHVREKVNVLYNPSVNTTLVGLRRRAVSMADSFSHVSFDMARKLRVNNLERQWSITIVVDRFPTEMSFAIDFFMGDAPEEVASWALADNLIATYAQFGPANATSVHTEGSSGGQVSGEISITHTLAAGVSRGIIRSLSPRYVVPLLRRALTWKARTPCGVEVEVEQLSGLSISVSSKSVVPSNARNRFPLYGAVEWQGSATEGKPCGARRPHVRRA